MNVSFPMLTLEKSYTDYNRLVTLSSTATRALATIFENSELLNFFCPLIMTPVFRLSQVCPGLTCMKILAPSQISTSDSLSTTHLMKQASSLQT